MKIAIFGSASGEKRTMKNIFYSPYVRISLNYIE
jgi:hypothetical protein